MGSKNGCVGQFKTFNFDFF